MDIAKLPQEDDKIDIHELLGLFVVYWYWFFISIVVCLGIAFWINYTSVPVYDVKTSILIEEGKSMLDERFSSSLIVDNTSLRTANQVSILKSYSLVKRAIHRLDFRISYFSDDRFVLRELYKASPFRVIPDTSSFLPANVPIDVEIESPTRFSVRIKAKAGRLYDVKHHQLEGSFDNLDIKVAGTIFYPVCYHNFKFTIIPASQADLKNVVGQHFHFVVNDDLTLVHQYLNIDIQENKASSLINVSVKGNNVCKLVDFLNTLSSEYLKKTLEKKNRIADNTIKFITTQLGDVADSLHFSEKTLQDYRTSHNVMDVSFQAQQVFTAMESLKNQRAELEIKNKYYDYIYNYLVGTKDGKDLITPSAIGIQDVTLNSFVSELIDLYSERLVFNSKQENPYMVSNNLRIEDLRQSVLKNIETLSNSVKISLQDIDKRIAEVSSKSNKLPEAERNLIGIERKFKLNDELYTYLLTKRSETLIAKASYLPDHEVIDEATPDVYTLISPQKKHNYIIAIIIGLAIPTILLLLRDYLNTKIRQDEDIEAVCKFPILGHIIRSKENTPTVIADYPMSLTAESVRAIRTNFQFLAGGRKQHTILFTSSIQGEGKSFSALNLALSFALFKKKTILLNFDLRKPKLQDYLGVDMEMGLSAYLSGNAGLDDIIVKTRFEYLDVINVGAIPPNPMELIGGEYTRILFTELKQQYDYVLIDTPPVGMVADSWLLLEFSDVNFFVARHRYTPKKVFSKLIENLGKRNIGNFNIILNDISINQRYTYKKGYAYGYGYGYMNEKLKKKSKFSASALYRKYKQS
jgi:tyrosine-protein kinase Etk/Wzc